MKYIFEMMAIFNKFNLDELIKHQNMLIKV